jgi:peptidoglycan/LPS O-acetylase OafA/YrhL
LGIVFVRESQFNQRKRSCPVNVADALHVREPDDVTQVTPASERACPRWLAQGQIPCLNGLRAISILFVVIAHLIHKPGPLPPFLIQIGEIGVEMFFVISGFLITLLLKREWNRTQTISLRNFYMRRSLRIIPAYACFLLVMFMFQFLGFLSAPPRAWVGAVTYTSSIIPGYAWDLGHTWSLSIEEMFYLFWPFLFVAVRRQRSFLAFMFCFIVTTFVPFCFWCLTFIGVEFGYFNLGNLTRLTCIFVGCCLALLATSRTYQHALLKCARPFRWLLFGSLSVLVLVRAASIFLAHYKITGLYKAFLSPTIDSVLLAIVVWVCVTNTDSVLSRILNSRPFHVVGLLSYSIYLWQQPFTNPERSGWIFQFPFNLVAIGVLAVVSYVLIESPFLKAKCRFSRDELAPAVP